MGRQRDHGPEENPQKLLSHGRGGWPDRWFDNTALVEFLRNTVLFIAIFFVSVFLINRLGIAIATVFLAATVFGLIYAFISWRSPSVPFFITILSVGGFRFLWSVKMPGMPDFYLDRLSLVWLVIVFGVKAVAERKPLRGPLLLDVLLLTNAIYIFLLSLTNDFAYFNLWTKSYLLPYAMYFMAKNIIVNQRLMRSMLAMLAILNVYYAVTSVAEKFGISALVWPKSILYTETVWWRRSNGPFAHAPLFGTVQGMILPTYLYFIATTKSYMVKYLNYGALILALAGLYFTYTRGSWLAGIVALGVAIFLNRRHYFRISLPALALVPVLAVFVLGVGSDTTMKDRMENEDTVTSRLGVAVTALRMWRDSPIIGVGFFQFQHHRSQYVDPVDVPIFGTVRFAHFRHTSIHDIYLGPLAETGLFGTFLQLAIYIVILRAFIRHYRRRDGPSHFRIYIMPVLGGLCVGYLAGGIAIDYRFFSMVGAMFYSAAGIVYGYRDEQETSNTMLTNSVGSETNAQT
jgi:O-antigen ligase